MGIVHSRPHGGLWGTLSLNVLTYRLKIDRKLVWVRVASRKSPAPLLLFPSLRYNSLLNKTLQLRLVKSSIVFPEGVMFFFPFAKGCHEWEPILYYTILYITLGLLYQSDKIFRTFSFCAVTGFRVAAQFLTPNSSPSLLKAHRRSKPKRVTHTHGSGDSINSYRAVILQILKHHVWWNWISNHMPGL